jgi:hypothetical protein
VTSHINMSAKTTHNPIVPALVGRWLREGLGFGKQYYPVSIFSSVTVYHLSGKQVLTASSAWWLASLDCDRQVLCKEIWVRWMLNTVHRRSTAHALSTNRSTRSERGMLAVVVSASFDPN